MTRERVAILGGGIAALTSAYWLSSTEELRERYEVTVHQVGWRLGGKLASSREAVGERNVEHGLHVWFGWYDNAFSMLADIYRDWPAPPGFPWKASLDAFDEQRYTPVGEIIDDEYTFWHFTWPKAEGSPGDGHLESEPIKVIGELTGLILRAVEKLIGDHGAANPGASAVPAGFPDHPLAASETSVDMMRWIEKTLVAGLHEDRLLRWALKEVHERLLPHLDEATEGNVDAHHLRNFFDVGLAVTRGLLNPEYDIPRDWNLDRIDELEFREWLIANGGRPGIVNGWSFLRALYDAMFQYDSGDVRRPNYAAGTALRAFLRCALTYRDAVLYLVKAGMGDVVIAPMYELLKSRGVRFEFFHKVRELKLNPDNNNQVGSVVIDVQAEVAVEDYEFTRELSNGLVVWNPGPVWANLKDGKKFEDAGVDFESKWGQLPPARTLTLEQDRDFDRVVLGVSLGAFKPMPGEPGMCAELARANPAFSDMVDNLGLVPSVAVQLWMNDSLEALGWTTGKPAAVAWSYPNDVWADMTQVLAYESWGTDAPGSLHYLTGVLGTGLFAEPEAASGVQEQANSLARSQTVEQMQGFANTIWPRATSPEHPTALDYEKLYDPHGGSGTARLDAQVIKANVTPTECCVGSGKGTTKYRLRADESGFENLTLCGAWIRTGLNSTCVEAAVMSGMAAARAISGTPETIVGEHFMGPGGAS